MPSFDHASTHIDLDVSYKKPREHITFSDIEKEMRQKRVEIKERDVVLIPTNTSKQNCS
jgi:hypothetical protein